jgi:hypothetical protein
MAVCTGMIVVMIMSMRHLDKGPCSAVRRQEL